MIAWLAALFLPALAGTGPEGLAAPTAIDITQLSRPSTPNTALAAPEGFSPAPDIVTRRYSADPDRLFAALRQVALAQPRTWLHGEFPDRRQAHFVARSARMNYPDLITVQVTPDSTVVLWSRSVYGRSDFGVNRARLVAWLAALDAALASP